MTIENQGRTEGNPAPIRHVFDTESNSTSGGKTAATHLCSMSSNARSRIARTCTAIDSRAAQMPAAVLMQTRARLRAVRAVEETAAGNAAKCVAVR